MILAPSPLLFSKSGISTRTSIPLTELTRDITAKIGEIYETYTFQGIGALPTPLVRQMSLPISNLQPCPLYSEQGPLNPRVHKKALGLSPLQRKILE